MVCLIASFCVWAGGRDQWKFFPMNQKLWKWLWLGYFISAYYGCKYREVYPILLWLTYFLATWASGYGENHPFRKWFGRDGAWIMYGFLFGLASFPMLGWLSIVQAIVASVSFWVLMKWSNDGFLGHKLSHQYVEIIYPVFGVGLMGVLC